MTDEARHTKLADIKKYIDENIETAYKTEQDSEMFIGNLFTLILEYGFIIGQEDMNQYMNEHKSEVDDGKTTIDEYNVTCSSICANHGVLEAHKQWCGFCKYLNIKYHQELLYSSFLIFMQSICNNLPKESSVRGYYQNAINYTIANTGDDLFMDIDWKDKPVLSDEELKSKLDEADESIIQLFFETFQSLGTFHRDITKYETEEQREKHKLLMSLYYKIRQESGSSQ